MGDTKLTSDKAFGELIDVFFKDIGTQQIPDNVKKRGVELNTFWEKDPMLVLSEYGNQAAQFNKLVRTQKVYLEALRNLPNTDNTFHKGLKRFIEEEFAVFTKGSAARGSFANKAVTSLNALQTARTMGLNITGAVKNAASAIHFYSRVGFGALNTARKDYYHDEAFRKVVDKAEKEAGFLFTDASQELYTEGLITKNDFDSGTIKYDPSTGKFVKGNTELKSYLIEKGQWGLDKALFFHRITENSQRKWMFRVGFNQKYKKLINNGYDPKGAETFARNYALQTVNAWAYEYASHAKSKMVRGEWRTIEEMNDGSKIVSKLKRTGAAVGIGAMSEAAMHLMHYPMSLAESTYSTLSGAKKAVLAGQGFEAPEIQHLSRYAGVAGVVSLISVLTNTNLFNILEHDTVERFQRVADDLTEYDNPDRGTFGLLSEFTGTNLGTLKHLMITGGVIDIENSDLNKVLFGNVDFADEDDRHTQMYNAYQYSTFWGTFANKLGPAIKSGRGRDLFTHWFKLYPNKTTKYFHEETVGKIWPKKKKKKSKQINKNLNTSLNLLRSFSNP